MADMGTLSVKLEAKTADFKRRMLDAKKTITGVAKDTEKAADDIGDGLTDAAREAGIYRDQMGKLREANGKFVKSARMAELGVENWNKAASKADTTNKKLFGSFTKLSGAFTKVGAGLGVGAGGVAAGVLAATTQMVNTGREIENLSRLANTGTTDFQRLAIGARRFGFDTDKTADILKDMNDRVGDFIQTGGGPMADFFENIAPKVGVTAENFKDLSGADALQLYVSSLEKANLSHADMTFYMEAIASDSTLLLPLLRDNGKALKEIGDEAERTGQVLSEMDLTKLKELDTSLRQIKGQLEGVKNDVLIEAIPAFQELADEINKPETIQNMQTLAKAAAELAKWTVQAAGAFTEFGGKLGQEVGVITQGIGGLDLEEQRGRILNALENPSERLRFFGPGGIVEYFDEEELKAELKRIDGLIEDQAKARKATSDMPASNSAGNVEEQRKLTDKQESLINTWTQKIADYEQRIISGENAAPLIEKITQLKDKIEDTKNATEESSTPVEENTDESKANTEALNRVRDALTGVGGKKAGENPLDTSQNGDKVSRDWENLIERAKRQMDPSGKGLDVESFKKASSSMIDYYSNIGGFDVDKMREQMEVILGKVGDKTKEGMTEAAKELTGGDAKKSIGSITITVKKDDGTMSGEVTGETGFLEKLANTLQGVSTSAGRTA